MALAQKRDIAPFQEQGVALVKKKDCLTVWGLALASSSEEVVPFQSIPRQQDMCSLPIVSDPHCSFNTPGIGWE